jgi:hypothetical protein
MFGLSIPDNLGVASPAGTLHPAGTVPSGAVQSGTVQSAGTAVQWPFAERMIDLVHLVSSFPHILASQK